MPAPDLSAFRDVLAARGLSIVRFDGHTLRLAYDQAADTERGADYAALASWAVVELDRIDQEGPSGQELFPGVQRVLVE